MNDHAPDCQIPDRQILKQPVDQNQQVDQQILDRQMLSDWAQVNATLCALIDSLAESGTASEPIRQLSQFLPELQMAMTVQQQHYKQLAAQHQTLLEQYRRDRQLVRITQRLRQSLDPNEILEQTVVAVQQLLQVDRALVYLFRANDQAKATTTVATVVAEAGQSQSASLVPNSLMGATIEAGSAKALAEFCRQGAIVLEQVDWVTLPPSLVDFVRQQQAIALLAVPIWQEDRLLGIVSASHGVGARVWQFDEIELLQQLVREVSIALRHSELYQQAQRLNLDLERQVHYRTEQLKSALDYESMLKRITDRVRDSLDEKHILQAAVQELTVSLKLAGCNAALYDPNQGTSTIEYEYTQSIPASQGRVAQMENFPEIYQQLHRGWCFQFCSLLPNPARGRVSMLACPIFVDPQSSRGVSQSVLGDLWLIHTKDHVFDEVEIRLVQQVANQCAIAIRQARLFQASQGRVQELAELNRLKDEFLSTVSHELRTPITNIKMAIQMLRNAPTDDKRAKYLEILTQETSREANLINDLLDLQQLQASPRVATLEVITLQDWLPKLIDPFQPRFVARQQQFWMHYSPDLPSVALEPNYLRRILMELLNNACKYTAPGRQISLIVDHEFDLEMHLPTVTFIIRNQASIPATELPKIFDKFYRCPNADPWKQGGTGLGLALVQKLVECLQGKLQVTSTNGWTQFTVKLPLSLDEAARS